MRRLAVLVFSIFLSVGLPLAYSAQLVDKVVAAVNGEIITQRQLDQEIFLIKKEWGIEDKKELREIALERMIQGQILLQEAEKEKITIPPRTVEEAISNIQRQFSANNFKKMLEEKNLSLEELRERLRRKLLGERLISYKAKKIEEELKIEEKEIRDFYLDLKNYIEKGGEVKGEIKEFCRKHREELSSTIPPKWKIRDKIREFLKQRKKEMALREWLEGLISKADIQIADK